MTTLPSWRPGRPKHLVLNVESTSAPSERSDVALYPSNDGKRIRREALSPSRKRQRHGNPCQLDDVYALWTPGIVGEEQGEEQDSVNSVAAGLVVVNPDADRDRKRYLSSVSFIVLALIPKLMKRVPGLSHAYLGRVSH